MLSHSLLEVAENPNRAFRNFFGMNAKRSRFIKRGPLSSDVIKYILDFPISDLFTAHAHLIESAGRIRL